MIRRLLTMPLLILGLYWFMRTFDAQFPIVGDLDVQAEVQGTMLSLSWGWAAGYLWAHWAMTPMRRALAAQRACLEAEIARLEAMMKEGGQ